MQTTPILGYVPGGGVGTVLPPPPFLPGVNGDITQLTSGQAYIQIIFDVPQTDNTWEFTNLQVVNTDPSATLNIWPGMLTAKSTTGFTLQLNGMPDSNNYFLHWSFTGIGGGSAPVVIPPATTYTLSGPGSGTVGTASTAFTVQLPGGTSVAAPVTVTPSDSGSGTFTPTSVTLTTGSPSATFTYTPASAGTKTISTTNSGGLTDPTSLTFTASAGFSTTYTLTGPSSGPVSVASTNFTVALPGGGSVSGTVIVTPADAGAGGTFTPTTVNLTTGAPSATFTYTPASSGAKTISVTNNGTLTDPANLTYTAVGRSRTLTVDHTKVPSTQTNFPVLVSFTDTDLKTVPNGGHVANANGYDIGFYSDAGLTTKLKWEIERYNASTGEVVAWVKIASLSSSVNTVFYLGYGDSTITTDQSDKLNVWTNSFGSVYHLGDGTTLNVNDALNVVNGTNNGATATAGQIDGGASFVAASVQYIALGSPTGAAAVTISAWIKGTSFPAGYNCVISRLDAPDFVTNQLMVKSNGKLAAFFNTGTLVAIDGTGSHTLSTATWYYLTVTYDSSSGMIGYVNASVDFTVAAAGALTVHTGVARIASDSGTAGREWNGVIDELRVASIVRSADWITTEYNNQNSPGTFITLGP